MKKLRQYLRLTNLFIRAAFQAELAYRVNFFVALRWVCLGPSLEALSGIDGELWTGRFDFTLLRPVDVQFLASFRQWRPFALIDLGFGMAVIARAVTLAGGAVSAERLSLFFLALLSAVVLIY